MAEQVEQARVVLLSAVPCEDEMRSVLDNAASLSRVFYVVSPDRLPYRQRMVVFAMWWLQTPGAARLTARVFSPELLAERVEDLCVEAQTLHAQMAGFGWLELAEPGLYRVELLRGDDGVGYNVAGSFPIFVQEPPAQAQEVIA